jgi:PDZ domain-containing protein
MTVRAVLSAFVALVGVLVIAAVALFIYAYITPSSSYLLLPDKPHALASLVEVQGGHQSGGGGIYFVDVVEQQASLAERYFPFLRNGGTLVPRADLIPNNVSPSLQERLDAAAMTRSKTIAEAVALKSLGYKVVTRPQGALIAQTADGSPAAAKLLPGDVIVAVDGQPALLDSRLHALISRHKVGQIVKLTIVRDRRRRQIALRTYALPARPKDSMIGVFVDQAASIKLPIKVSINAGNVVGPSAGLAFALELADKLGRNIDRGYRIAATGELALDGTVGEIGGVREKVIGARRAGIEIMLVPAGDNAAEARRYAGDMKIIAVTSFQQALHALATLPVRS